MKQVCVDPPRITALTLPARCCAQTSATDMDRKATAVDGTVGRTDGQTTVTTHRIGNESVPIQLAQCWYRGLPISNAKI